MEDEIPTPPVQEQKKVHANKGKKPSEKQMEALRKGMESLKKKREEMAKEKETRDKSNEVLREKGLPPIEKPVKIKKQEITEVKPVVVEPVQIKVKERKTRSDKGVPKKEIDAKAISKTEFNELKEMMKSVASIKQQEKVVEVEKPVIVEKVVPVEKTKIVSGSELLNQIFFSKK
jgi:hypothetical protein